MAEQVPPILDNPFERNSRTNRLFTNTTSLKRELKRINVTRSKFKIQLHQNHIVLSEKVSCAICNGTLWYNEIPKSRPKTRSNLTWQIEHVLAKVPAKKAVQKTRQPPTETTEQEHGERNTQNSKKTLSEVLIFSIMLP